METIVLQQYAKKNFVLGYRKLQVFVKNYFDHYYGLRINVTGQKKKYRENEILLHYLAQHRM